MHRTVSKLAIRVVALAAMAAASPAWADNAPHQALLDDLEQVSMDESGWASPTTTEPLPADGLLVDLKDDLTAEQLATLERETGVHLTDTTAAADGNLYAVHGTATEIETAIRALTGRREVESVEPNVYYSLFEVPPAPADAPLPTKPPGSTTPNDPMYGSQWHLAMVDAEGAWQRTKGEGVIVAVVDTGVSAGEIDGKPTRFKRVPDLRETAFAPGFNFVDNTPDASDGNGHGTHVAGTIAQSTNNGFGVAGLAPGAIIMPIKVLSDRGSGTVADIANGIRFAADKGAKVINMSLGGGMYSSTLARAVKYAHDKGVTVVCAAGNGGRQKVEYPAAYPGCVAVSALGPDGKLAFYSSYGKETDIAAPGGDTRVDLNGDGIPDGVLQDTIARGDPTKHGFFPFQGTSMATPHVAAAAALVIATGVSDPDGVEAVLKGSARPMNDVIRYGAGGLDAANAVKGASREHSVGGLGVAGLLAALAMFQVRRRRGSSRALGFGFYASLIMGASGLFVLREVGLGSLPGLSLLASPVAEWPAVLFGPMSLNPLVGSIALVLVPAALLFGMGKARAPLAGFAFGLAGFFFVRAGLGSVDVAFIPGHGLLDASWLVLNGSLAFAFGRLLVQKD